MTEIGGCAVPWTTIVMEIIRIFIVLNSDVQLADLTASLSTYLDSSAWVNNNYIICWVFSLKKKEEKEEKQHIIRTKYQIGNSDRKHVLFPLATIIQPQPFSLENSKLRT